jgi:hypothetical protein
MDTSDDFEKQQQYLDLENITSFYRNIAWQNRLFEVALK